MTLKDLALKNEWDAHWFVNDSNEPTRELLTKILNVDSILEAVNISDAIARIAVACNLSREINLSISDGGITIFLNAYNDGPLDERFYELANAIDKELDKTLLKS